MKIKSVIRKVAELGVGITAITVLVLAGCGGGGGSSPAAAAASTSTTFTPFKGFFSSGHITLRDRDGLLVTQTGGDIANGHATVTFPSNVNYPLVASVSGVYINEVTGASEVTGTSPLLGLVADATAASSAVPVTAITNMAVAQIAKAVGSPIDAPHSTSLAPADAVNAISAVVGQLGIPNTVPVFNASGVPADTNTVALAGLSQEAAALQSGNLAAALQNLATTWAQNPASSVAAIMPTLSTAIASAVALNEASGVAITPPDVTPSPTPIGPVVLSPVLAQITAAKNLLTSLRSNVLLLGNTGNTGNTGFLQNQASAVQSDFTASTGAFGESKTFLKFVTNAVGLLRNHSNLSTTIPIGITVYSNGQPGYCGALAVSGVANTGEVACQWISGNSSGTAMSTHQLLVQGPVPATTFTGASTQTGSYTWADTIIGTTGTSPINQGQVLNGLGAVITFINPSTYTTGTNLYGVNSFGVVTNPVIHNTPGLTAAGITGLTTPFGLTANTSGTLNISGAFGFDTNGNFTPGSSATAVLSGYTLPGAVTLSTTIDHLQHNWTAYISASTVTAGTQETFALNGTTSRWTSPTNASPNGIIDNSITLGTGSTVVDIAGTSTTKPSPVSANLSITATTPNYSFSGVVGMSMFAQDASCLTVDFLNNCVGNWYPQTTTFTGSVAGINSNSNLGTFMTGTLGVNMNRTPDGSSFPGYDPTIPSGGCTNLSDWCNYQITSGTFSGSIVNGSSTYHITNLVGSNGNTLTAFNPVGTLSLTYSDPSSNVVTVNMTGTALGVPGSGTATLGSSGIAIAVGTGGIGNVYSGYSSPTSTGTLLGSISGGMVYFVDGTTQSIK